MVEKVNVGENYPVDGGGDTYFSYVLYAFRNFWPNILQAYEVSQPTLKIWDERHEKIERLEPDYLNYKGEIIFYENESVYNLYEKSGIESSIKDSIIICTLYHDNSIYSFSEKNKNRIVQIHEDYLNNKHTKEEIDQWFSNPVG